MNLRNAVVRLLLLTFSLTALAPAPGFVAKGQSNADDEETTGLRFRLSEGVAPTEKPTPSPVVTATDLSDADTKKLLARLPAFALNAGDALEFKFPTRTLLPPRTGKIIEAAFAVPSPEGPTVVAPTMAPLEVLRVSPDGEVDLAPMVSITFSQPMIAVSSQDEAAAQVPVTLTPQPKGRWRWLGTQTLIFQPEAEGGRFPMATEYQVTIPAGTKSVFGNGLTEAKSFTFATPAPSIEKSYPEREGNRRDAVMFLSFDQRIDAVRMLANLKLEPDVPGLRLRVATPDEIAGDESVRDLVKEATEGRWFAFRAVNVNGSTTDVLPAGTHIKLVVPKGAASSEGPRITTGELDFTFKTYDLLNVSYTNCQVLSPCSPFESFNLKFNNYLDRGSSSPSMVTISPPIPHAPVSFNFDSITIDGDKQSNTDYTVTLDRTFKDHFGQTLSGTNTFTFKVKSASSALFGPDSEFIVLDPAARPTFKVNHINTPEFRVRLSRVSPDDWEKYRDYQRQRREQGQNLELPGKVVFDQVINPSAKTDVPTESLIDLTPALRNGHGQVVVQVERVQNPDSPMRVYVNGDDGRIVAWVQATEISLDAFADSTGLTAWANSLRDGKPLGGVEISVIPDKGKGTTGANGLARIALNPIGQDEYRMGLLVARRGEDTAILPQLYNPYLGNRINGWRRINESSGRSWHVFDDRGLYRPGEEVSVKGWIRETTLLPRGDVGLYSAAGRTVNYVLKDAKHNEITKGSTKLNSLAGFDLKLQLPTNVDLGAADLELTLDTNEVQYHHRFQIQEFRRPEFQVKTEVSNGPHFIGTSATIEVNATYYTGGALAGADVNWRAVSVPTNFTPPHRDAFTFGKFIPWWRHADYEGQSEEQGLKAKTNADGKHVLKVDLLGVTPARPSILMVDALVKDVNRQSLYSSSQFLVHPAELYVGLKADRTFVQKGQSFEVDAIVTDLDGKSVPGRTVKLRLVRYEYVYGKGEWTTKEVDLQEQTIQSGTDVVKVQFPTNEGGSYGLTAQVSDERERLNETELSLWVAGGTIRPSDKVEQETVDLIPDRKTYAGGDVAEILVQSPITPAEGVLTLRRSGILRTERFTMTESSYTLRVPIEEGMTPNLQVQVDVVGTQPRVDGNGKVERDLPKRSAYASGSIDLSIPPVGRRLHVTAEPRNSMMEPNSETVVEVTVKDAAGKPVPGTDTAVYVVDESVLALIDYQVKDPIESFYPVREAGVSDYHLREHLKLATREAFIEMFWKAGSVTEVPIKTGAFGAEYGKSTGGVFDMLNTSDSSASVTVTGSAPDPEIGVRKNFNALAVFAASVPTDAQGRAQVKVKLPDNLTRYRVIAVSVAGGKQAGTGESTITARKRLMARPSAPRFLNFGDRAELPVVLQNQTDQPMSVDVAVRAINAELTAGAGRRVTIPANDRVEVRFPVTSALPGLARFQVVTAAGALTDAAEVSLPVYTPATTETFATYGTIDQGNIAQPVKVPADAFPQFGGLEVTTASTQLQELTDAVIYLNNYPFECSEQISSRLMALAALKDVLGAFKAKDLPSPEAMSASVDRDIKRLSGLQNEDGGFDFWIRGKTSNPYVSVHVAHALVRAHSKGFAIPEEMLNEAKGYLKNIESKLSLDFSPESRFAIRAYALYVRNLMKDTDSVKALQLLADAGGVEKLSLESLGWLLPVLASEPSSAETVTAIRHHINNRITETAGAAHFADSYSDGAYTILYSDCRTDGVLLEALIGDQPNSDLIPKLVRGLLDGRKQGHWMNTQENVFILLALDRYFNTYEKATPDFVARVWLGQDFAGDQTFKGRSVDRQQLNLPMATLAERTANGPANLTIAKEGEGRLYYRIGTRYAPKSLNLAAADYGFKVERVYEAIDNPSDVRREADGTWVIKAGSRIRVRLKMSNPARRYHVALVDPLPAGLEVLNPELATTEDLPDEDNGGRNYRYWRSIWYDHQNLRDDRIEAFTSYLWEGEHLYTYFARATTLGLFIVPPTKAEEMYAPETFGRGASDKVRIE